MSTLEWLRTLSHPENLPHPPAPLPAPPSRDALLALIRLAEQAERYEDMLTLLSRLVTAPGPDLTAEERNLLSVGYKNLIGSRRAAWRVAHTVEARERDRASGNAPHATAYRKTMEREIAEIARSVVRLVDTHLLPGTTDGESRVFYLKMKGDYHRYHAEASEEEEAEARQAALEAYKAASELTMEIFPATHPIGLGLALNFSVFYYEILKETQKGLTLAKEAYEKALDEIDALDEETYKEASLILQLLKDNIALWVEDEDES